jgi:hypothetical protein
MNSKTITLKKAKEIFPSKYTKVRSHDLISLSLDKKEFLTEAEIQKLQNLAGDIKNYVFGKNQDMMAIRTGKKIKFEAMYDD